MRPDCTCSVDESPLLRFGQLLLLLLLLGCEGSASPLTARSQRLQHEVFSVIHFKNNFHAKKENVSVVIVFTMFCVLS